MIILFTGGARSGKSTRAEQYAARLGRPVVYLATAEAGDDEMRARIARHRARSGGKARDSQRYRKLVTRVRGMLKTRRSSSGRWRPARAQRNSAKPTSQTAARRGRRGTVTGRRATW
ncbi:MAG: bifunctional adenosylcobinamide kinase/adenosylcobinamide-phosphate guanylyltransferase [Chloroflexales bacterium]